jgi:hypothetical protein
MCSQMIPLAISLPLDKVEPGPIEGALVNISDLNVGIPIEL